MLVLDRKLREGFWIDGGIFVKVLSVGRERVKLGIEAPDDVRIVREELRSPERVGAHARNINGAGDS
jgi:carbon storage regulator